MLVEGDRAAGCPACGSFVLSSPVAKSAAGWTACGTIVASADSSTATEKEGAAGWTACGTIAGDFAQGRMVIERSTELFPRFGSFDNVALEVTDALLVVTPANCART